MLAHLPPRPQRRPQPLLCTAGGELLPAMLSRLSAVPRELSPQEMAAAAWTLTRFNARLYGLRQLPTLVTRHISARLDDYSAADTICVLWALAHFKRTLPGGWAGQRVWRRKRHPGRAAWCTRLQLAGVPPATATPARAALLAAGCMRLILHCPPPPCPADATLLRVLHALRPRLAQCSTSSLCNLLWALGRMAGVASGAIKPKRQRQQMREDWISTPVGAELLATASEVLVQLMQPRRMLKPHELASVAVAVAAHADHATAFPAALVAALRSACAAAAAARELSHADLAHVAGAAARLRWQDQATVDALALDMQARGSSWPSEVRHPGGLRWAAGRGLCIYAPPAMLMPLLHPPPPAGVHPVRLGAGHPGARPPRAPV